MEEAIRHLSNIIWPCVLFTSETHCEGSKFTLFFFLSSLTTYFNLHPWEVDEFTCCRFDKFSAAAFYYYFYSLWLRHKLKWRHLSPVRTNMSLILKKKKPLLSEVTNIEVTKIKQACTSLQLKLLTDAHIHTSTQNWHLLSSQWEHTFG